MKKYIAPTLRAKKLKPFNILQSTTTPQVNDDSHEGGAKYSGFFDDGFDTENESGW